MKTISITNREFPTPIKLAIYLLSVTALSLLNWAVLSASDNTVENTLNLENRLAEALAPAADPHYELEAWMLTPSGELLSEETQAAKKLEERLAKALKPVEETKPALDNWLLNFSQNYFKSSSRTASELQIRLAEALKPIPDPEPELEDWMFRISDVLLHGDL